ncbi:MAG: response regulator, partial [Flavobacteriales bacterium]|nr:response regulator [Flavobacteriales bacterium]
MKQVRIFIVEDEPLIAEDLAASLEELGYQVCGRAENALDAMAGIATEKPDLILMDIN